VIRLRVYGTFNDIFNSWDHDSIELWRDLKTVNCENVEWSVEAGGGVNVVYFKVIHMKAKIKKELLNIYGKPTILTPNTFQMIVKGITNAMQNYS